MLYLQELVCFHPGLPQQTLTLHNYLSLATPKGVMDQLDIGILKSIKVDWDKSLSSPGEDVSQSTEMQTFIDQPICEECFEVMHEVRPQFSSTFAILVSGLVPLTIYL